MKKLLIILLILNVLVSCSEYRKFTLYKQKPFDKTSDSIYLKKVFTVKHFKEDFPEYIHYNQFLFNSDGTYNAYSQYENVGYILGQYIVRHDTLFMQHFGYEPGGSFKKYLKEDFAKIINDSTITFYFHRCHYCHGQYSGYHKSSDIFFEPPLEYNVTSDVYKWEIDSSWFLKKKWYKKNVWYNNE